MAEHDSVGRATFPTENKADKELKVAIDELRALVDGWMKARQGVAAPLMRDVAVARVIAENTALAERIVSLSLASATHKSDTVSVRKRIEEVIEGEASEIQSREGISHSAAFGKAWVKHPRLYEEHRLAGALAPLEKRAALDGTVARLAKALGGDNDPGTGLRYIGTYFGPIYDAWRPRA